MWLYDLSSFLTPLHLAYSWSGFFCLNGSSSPLFPYRMTIMNQKKVIFQAILPSVIYNIEDAC